MILAKLKIYGLVGLLCVTLLGSAFSAGYFYCSHRTKVANMKIEIEAFEKSIEIEKRLIETEKQLQIERDKLEELAREEPANPGQCLGPSRVRRLNQIR